MGQCHSEKSIKTSPVQADLHGPTKGKKSLPASSSTVERENYNIMISYCWDDKILCHTVADRFVEDGLHIWIDRDKMTGDLYTAMANAIDRSDIILLCISESYFHSQNCQKEARYAADRNKVIIPIIVTPKYTPKEWLRFIIAGKLYFRLAGSETQFNTTYDKLLKEILQHTRRGPSLPPPERPIPTEEQVREHRIAYEAALRKQIEKDRPKIIEMKKHIDQIPKDIPSDKNENNSNHELVPLSLNELPGIKRWKVKYPELTWLNFAPFTPTGDINDAVYMLPPDVAQEPTKFLRKWLNSYQSFICGGFGNAVHEKVRQVPEVTRTHDKTVDMKDSKKLDESLVYYMKLIERNWCFITSISKGKPVWSTIDGFIGSELKTKEEIARRQLLDSDLSIMKKRRQQLSAFFHAEPDTFCRFAQQMRQNIVDFEEACKKTFTRMSKNRK